MATQIAVPWGDRGYRRIGGADITMRNRPEAASQTFERGDPVYLNAGLVTLCGTDPANIYGFAKHDALEVTNANDQVTLALTDIEFVAHVLDAQTIPQSLVGNAYGITLEGNIWRVDTSKTGGTARVVVRELFHAAGDTAGAVWCSVLRANQQQDG